MSLSLHDPAETLLLINDPTWLDLRGISELDRRDMDAAVAGFAGAVASELDLPESVATQITVEGTVGGIALATTCLFAEIASPDVDDFKKSAALSTLRHLEGNRQTGEIVDGIVRQVEVDHPDSEVHRVARDIREVRFAGLAAYSPAA